MTSKVVFQVLPWLRKSRSYGNDKVVHNFYEFAHGRIQRDKRLQVITNYSIAYVIVAMCVSMVNLFRCSDLQKQASSFEDLCPPFTGRVARKRLGFEYGSSSPCGPHGWHRLLSLQGPRKPV